MSGAVDLRERLELSLGEMQEPGAAEICDLLWETMRPRLDPDASIRLELLKKEVYRLHLGSGQSLVLKRLKPATAQTARTVVERRLPAPGFGGRCARVSPATPARGCADPQRYGTGARCGPSTRISAMKHSP